MALHKPEPLTNQQLDSFDCGNATLNDWLKKRAARNQREGASRTFVLCEKSEVVGYYALSSGSIERQIAPKALSRNMPEAIPVMILGRLAIDLKYQGKSLGSLLLRDAIYRVLNVSQQVGVRAILVHAISEDAKRFYEQYGFKQSPVESLTLFLPIKSLRNALA